jgi:transposase-like protein
MIDGIHFGGQVLVAALGIAESGEKHVLGVWQGATENTTVVKGLLEDLGVETTEGVRLQVSFGEETDLI